MTGVKLTDTTGLPSNFSSISNLNTLNISNSLFTSIPNVSAYPSLSSLSIYYSSTLTSWGDLTGLGDKLNTLNVTSCGNLTPTIPSYLSSLTRLRTFIWLACGFSQSGKIDTFITNFYNFIVANAVLVGANTLNFRGMRVRLEAESGSGVTSNGVIPTGTYQQPTGYIQGSNNGTPSSSLERIWVLENQYLHNITYRIS